MDLGNIRSDMMSEFTNQLYELNFDLGIKARFCATFDTMFKTALPIFTLDLGSQFGIILFRSARYQLITL